MAAAMSAGSGGTLRRRDDVPSSRIAELWCTGRWERDGARRAAEPALEHVRARHELHEAIPASAAARAWRAELPGTPRGRARLVDPQKIVIMPW